MRWLLLIVVVGGIASLLVPRRRRKDRVDLGSVSDSWIAEHRADQSQH